MRAIVRSIVLAWAILGCGGAYAQGTIPLALSQVSDVNGKPLIGCQLFTYQAGTVATPQNSFADFALTQVNPNPLTCDQFGRIPMFWLANGLIHARLLDANGVQQVDVTMQVLGPSTGGGGGGGTVDPTTIAATGDVKFRMTAETVIGWVKLNGLTIGGATSGATGRANADTQALFLYLWTNCTNAHCAVPGGRGVSALADFNANKVITLPSWQDKAPIGRDCMEASCAGVLLSSNVTSGGGDGVDTPGAFGGAANTPILQTNMPATGPTFTGTPQSWGLNGVGTASFWGGGQSGAPAGSGAVLPAAMTQNAVTGTAAITPSGTIAGGSGTPFAVMDPFILGSWYLKL